MARRTEKLTFTKLVLLIGIAVWLPALFRLLAGKPDDGPTPPTSSNPIVLEVKPVSHTTETYDSAAQQLPAPDDLVLRSTYVSADHSFAVINGQVFERGDTLRSAEREFQVEEIGEGRVTLTSGGKRYDLQLDNAGEWGRWAPFEADEL